MTSTNGRFRQSGTPSDLDEAVVLWRRVVAETTVAGPDRSKVLSHLGGALQARFLHSRQRRDLDEAIEVCRQTLDAAANDDPWIGTYLANLGNLLRTRAASAADLDEGLECGRQAIARTAPDRPERSDFLGAVGVALLERFLTAGDPDDLDDGVELCRQSAAAVSSAERRGRHLAGLGAALRLRFRVFGSMVDLDDAVHVYRQAVAATPAADPDRSAFVFFLATALQTRFSRTQELANLNEAITLLTTAPADHAEHLCALADALARRSVHTGRASDLRKAMRLARRALAATKVGHQDRAGCLSALAQCHFARFQRTRKAADVRAAVALTRQAVDATPAGDEAYAARLGDLAETLAAEGGLGGDEALLAESMLWFRRAAAIETAMPRARLRDGFSWARLAADRDDQPAVRAAWQHMLAVLPQFVDRHLSRAERQAQLSQLAGLGVEAAAAAVANGDAEGAWSALEQGRGVLLAQDMQLRSDDELRRRHPDLAERVDRLRTLLNNDAPPGADPGEAPGTAMSRRSALVRGWERLLTEIRGRDGFDRFGLQPSPGQLRQAAGAGVVVAVNVAQRRCDALVLTAHGAEIVNLPKLSQADALERAERFQRAVMAGTPQHSGDVIRPILEWMWDTIAEPVLTHLRYLGTPEDGAPWPRLWWIATSVLSVLPLHAAGYHDDPLDGRRRAVLDRVVSSYTPTVLALRTAGRPRGSRSPSALVVGIDGAGGGSPLVGAGAEATWVHDALRSSRPPLIDADATRSAVLSALPEVGWAHFACHAETTVDPADSHLLLHDGSLSVRDLADLDLDRAYLAYLSACTTAFGGNRLLDESAHIAAAFQVAGFPQVIATLWPTVDRVAGTLAREIYARIIAGAEPAYAVHEAVRAIRAHHPRQPYRWAGHLHFGP